MEDNFNLKFHVATCTCRSKLQSFLLKPSADQVDQKPSPSLLALQSPSSFTSTSGGRANKSYKKRKRIPYTLVEASKGNHCPTPGCDGVDHLTGMNAMHFAVSGCPKAHGKPPEECRAREELNRLRLKATLIKGHPAYHHGNRLRLFIVVGSWRGDV